MSTPPTKQDVCASYKALIREHDLEKDFLALSGLDSLDELHPNNFKDLVFPKAPIVSRPSTSAAPVPAPQLPKKVADAKSVNQPTVASDILEPFIDIQINYASRRRTSSYNPSCLMMDYVVHIINDYLVDNHYFKRDAPNYHPYILRLYYGVIFWVQCLRAGHDARAINNDQHQFLVQFVECHPLESLPVAGPLLPIFKTLCSSEPEIKSYGKVVPKLPEHSGPLRRDSFLVESVPHFFLPNIPGIFALIEHLNSLINGEIPTYPAKGKHIPVTSTANTATIFGHHSFPVLANRTNFEKYALCSPGLQYLCEADKRLNEAFAERLDYFEFPTTAAGDNLRSTSAFLHMNNSMAWFSQVKTVAAIAANYITGSGTLADCSPSGLSAGQYVAVFRPPSIAMTAPQHSADKRALFPFAFRLHTTARNPAPMVEAMAAMAQTHIQMFATHPYLGNFGHPIGNGPFWDIRPVEKSEADESAYLALPTKIKAMVKSKDTR
ncbi:coat protein [Paris alphapartitivirus]|nr:coat protein [Paris alphapartitivirus]